MKSTDRHEAVMPQELMEALSPRDGGIYVDGTFGAGGHAKALLTSADCSLIAIDRDPEAVRRGLSLAADWQGRLRLIEGRFGSLRELLANHAVFEVDGIALDVGVSSMQLEQAERGFSFRHDGPLDMRMSSSGLSAADLVNRLNEAELTRVIAVYGEERQARKVARAIVAARTRHPLARTRELADIVGGVVGLNGYSPRHPATRVFQALRILVNDELGELARGLSAAERILKPGGRLAVIAFHSLEDRLVKRFFRKRSGNPRKNLCVSRYQPFPAEQNSAREHPAPSFRLLFVKPRRPGPEELSRNHRARSARLRAAERTSSASFPDEDMPEEILAIAAAHQEAGLSPQ